MVDQFRWRHSSPPASFLYSLSSGHLLVAPPGMVIDTLGTQNAWLAMQYHMSNENGGDSFHCMTNRFDPQLHIRIDKLRTQQIRFLCQLRRCRRPQELPNLIYGFTEIGWLGEIFQSC